MDLLSLFTHLGTHPITYNISFEGEVLFTERGFLCLTQKASTKLVGILGTTRHLQGV